MDRVHDAGAGGKQGVVQAGAWVLRGAGAGGPAGVGLGAAVGVSADWADQPAAPIRCQGLPGWLHVLGCSGRTGLQREVWKLEAAAALAGVVGR